MPAPRSNHVDAQPLIRTRPPPAQTPEFLPRDPHVVHQHAVAPALRDVQVAPVGAPAQLRDARSAYVCFRARAPGGRIESLGDGEDSDAIALPRGIVQTHRAREGAGGQDGGVGAEVEGGDAALEADAAADELFAFGGDGGAGGEGAGAGAGEVEGGDLGVGAGEEVGAGGGEEG